MFPGFDTSRNEAGREESFLHETLEKVSGSNAADSVVYLKHDAEGKRTDTRL